jgi:hypothetical protein
VIYTFYLFIKSCVLIGQCSHQKMSPRLIPYLSPLLDLSLSLQAGVFLLDQSALDQRVLDLLCFALVGSIGEVGGADLEAFLCFFAFAVGR